MSEANRSQERTETVVESACCGVGGCCSDAERSLDPAVTVTEAKTSAGCGCVTDAGEPGLPVVVIGAGPVGLATAAHLAERGLDFVVLEAGARVGAAISEWGHVRLFSPWRYDTDAAARRLLEPTGWKPRDPDALPTGAELVRDYLAPLAEVPALAGRIHTGTRVIAVTRHGLDITRTIARDEHPLLVRTVDPDGAVTDLAARAVIDASGTWGHRNPLGHSGLPAPGEDEAAAHLTGPLPDVLGRDRDRFAGRRTLVVGMGHSAANTLLALAELAKAAPGTRITWAVRGSSAARLYGGGGADGLPARGALGTRLKKAVQDGEIELVRGFTITRFTTGSSEQAVQVTGATPDGEHIIAADTVVAATGFRPDLDMLREVRLDLDPATQAPTKLAPLIDPNFHSCGTVPPHGERDLAHPETGFYLAGMKSYGRAPTFLMATGYEQVRSIVAAIAGDREAADSVQLDLPETGVCSTNLVTEDQLPGSAAQDAGCGTSCSTPSAPDPAAHAEAESSADGGACCGGRSTSEPVGIGFGAPAGLGFSTGIEHGHSSEAEPADA